jgi:hypothetical protein
MATNNTTNGNGSSGTPHLTKWNGFTVAFGATEVEARILGYMWDAQQRTRR